jgi:phage terminase large subunit-like protein
MLTERNMAKWRREAMTYQQVNGIWFPRETEDKYEDSVSTRDRTVFSQVVLNEPVDESVFDVNKPF